ncbi:hypothetical protein LCGC14_1659540, partial [marine sediment metagenome]
MNERSPAETTAFEISDSVTSYGADDAWDYQGKKVVEVPIGYGHDTQTGKPTLLETFFWLTKTYSNRFGAKFAKGVQYVGLWGDQVIGPGVTYLDQNGKVRTMKYNSIFPDLLADIGHEFLVDSQGNVLDQSFIKFVPVSELTMKQYD